jgi:predicted nucleotidyltransferase component of viral defense system
MNAEFINEMAAAMETQRKDLVEKDIILQELLLDLSENKFFAQNFAFKGGTCLVKCYMGYYRLSEDIDFTWIDQSDFNTKNQNEITRKLSTHIDKVAETFESITTKRGLDFKYRKGDRRYVEIGGSKKMLTFKLWYNSAILGKESFIKVQVNFLEKIHFGLTEKAVKGMSVPKERQAELSRLFQEYKDYSKEPTLMAYDVKELLAEKVRAILTRKGVKTRDFIDIYMINQRFGLVPEDIDSIVVEKTLFALRMYGKYRDNFEANLGRLTNKEFSISESERDLLINDLDEKKFQAFLKNLYAYISELSERIANMIIKG